MKAGVLRLPAGQAEYERIVTYELAPAGPGTAITCTAQTSIPGLAKSAARMGSKAETKSMRRSLERMRTCAEGGQAGAAGRFMDSNYSGQAL
jgi:hypothetical protein